MKTESSRIAGILKKLPAQDATVVLDALAEREQAEEKLRESEKKSRAWLEYSPACTKIVDLDFNLQYMSSAGIRGLGVEDVTTLYGHPYPFSFYPESFKNTMRRNLSRAKETGEVITQEAPVVDTHGGTLWFHSTIVPVHGDEGKIEYIIVVSIDTTERRKAEEELQHLRNYLSNIINSMPSMLVGVDSDGVITQWNQQAVRATGLSPKSAIGQSFAEAVPRLANEMNRVGDAMQSRQTQTNLKHAHQESGEIRYEDITVYPLIANGVEGAVIRVDDVTDRVRIEEMMVQSEKMMSVGGLAAGMAHEINNPLAGMMQTASVLTNRLTDLEMPANRRAAEELGISMEDIGAFMEARGIAKSLDRIREAGTRAAEIVSNMLSFARKSDSGFSMYNLARLLDQCIGLAGSDFDLKKKYDFRQIEVVRVYEDDLPLVSCQSGKIQQVLLNLLRNSAEAMHANGCVERKPRLILRLAHEKEAGMVRIEIEDNGPGMDEATGKRAFEPFFTTKSPDRGTGLGLSVSYFIITENHGGEMRVESRPGEGSVFVVRLPLEKSPT